VKGKVCALLLGVNFIGPGFSWPNERHATFLRVRAVIGRLDPRFDNVRQQVDVSYRRLTYSQDAATSGPKVVAFADAEDLQSLKAMEDKPISADPDPSWKLPQTPTGGDCAFGTLQTPYNDESLSIRVISCSSELLGRVRIISFSVDPEQGFDSLQRTWNFLADGTLESVDTTIAFVNKDRPSFFHVLEKRLD